MILKQHLISIFDEVSPPKNLFQLSELFLYLLSLLAPSTLR